jgi:hypothetical protein
LCTKTGPSDSMATLLEISRLPGRQFRTMLRLLSAGMYVSQAHEILARRSAAGLEVQADDVNTLLSSCAFSKTQRSISTFLTTLKKNGMLVGQDDLEIETNCELLLDHVESGSFPDLEDARKKRSPEMHPQNAKQNAVQSAMQIGKGARSLDRINNSGNAGGSDGNPFFPKDVEGRKRKRMDEEDIKNSEDQRSLHDNDNGDRDKLPVDSVSVSQQGEDLLATSTVKSEVSKTKGESIHQDEGEDDPCAESSEAASAAYKRFFDLLSSKFLPRETEWAQKRFKKANEVFLTMSLPPLEVIETELKQEEAASISDENNGPLRKLKFSGLGIPPNARSYVILLFAALESGDIVAGKRLFDALKLSGHFRTESIHEFFQPAFLFRLRDADIITTEQLEEALTSLRDTPKWFFLKAVAEAMMGDQYGSKHGSVVTRNGKYLSHGRNHRFGLATGDSHLRVMHSEIHALSKLPSKEDAIGCECWIVELDGHGVGYEEARPCPMCNKGVHKLGVSAVHYSSHCGVKSEKITYKPNLRCESYDSALTACYPKGTFNPNENSDDPTFDFFSSKIFVDPGRGKGSQILARQSMTTTTTTTTSTTLQEET